MGKKCFVKGCRSNYDQSKAKSDVLRQKNNNINNGEKVRLFGLPPITKLDERNRWIKAIPFANENSISELRTNPHICIKHWPKGFPVKSERGKERPVNPPSVFDGIPTSSIPSQPPPPRPTYKCRFEERTRQDDQLSKFLEMDKISFEKLTKSLKSGEYELEVKIMLFPFILSYKYMTQMPFHRVLSFPFSFERLFGFNWNNVSFSGRNHLIHYRRRSMDSIKATYPGHSNP